LSKHVSILVLVGARVGALVGAAVVHERVAEVPATCRKSSNEENNYESGIVSTLPKFKTNYSPRNEPAGKGTGRSYPCADVGRVACEK
jgi:hypothetical protein